MTALVQLKRAKEEKYIVILHMFKIAAYIKKE
jgi:hypothetical protein